MIRSIDEILDYKLTKKVCSKSSRLFLFVVIQNLTKK
jgi:hypothetical protein